jgi:hypothetical protein
MAETIMQLTAQNVNDLASACLFKEDETMLPRIEVEGIINLYGFHPGRIETHYDDIVDLLGQLPDQFHQGKGGGWTFLNGCLTKDEVLWGQQPDVGMLFALGMAAGRVLCPLPREVWDRLPGCVPYYLVTTKRFNVPMTTEEKGKSAAKD